MSNTSSDAVLIVTNLAAESYAIAGHLLFFSSIRIKESQVRKLSPTSALIVARVLIEAAAGGHNLSTDTLTSILLAQLGEKNRRFL